MLHNFNTYQLAVQFHHHCEELKVPEYLRDQLMRASASIVLNIAEGSAKPTAKDQRKYYAIALGSLRECQAVGDLVRQPVLPFSDLANQLGACLHTLVHGRKAV